MQHPVLNAVESVCNDFDGNGIYSVGAIGALRAMSHHWKDHLAEGHNPKIVSDDIEEMIRQLEIMRAQIVRRLPRAASTTASGVCGKCGSHMVGDYCSDDACPYSEWPQRVPLAEIQEVATSVLRKKWEVLPRIRIYAEVHDDAHLTKVEFDAALWFAQATDSQIARLHDIGWTGDEPSDVVAEFFESRNKDIEDMFDFCRATKNTRNQIGFECSVDEDSAMDWLKQHRPGLWAVFLCQDNEVRLVEAQEEEIAGMWDWLDNEGNACDHSFDTIGEAALNAVHVLGLSN